MMILESDLESGKYDFHIERIIQHCGDTLSENDLQSQLKIRKLTAFLARFCADDNQVKMIKRRDISKMHIRGTQQKLFTRLQILCNMKRLKLHLTPLFQIVQLSPRLMCMDDIMYKSCLAVWNQQLDVPVAYDIFEVEETAANVLTENKKKQRRRADKHHVGGSRARDATKQIESDQRSSSNDADNPASSTEVGDTTTTTTPIELSLEDICRQNLVSYNGENTEGNHDEVWWVVGAKKSKKSPPGPINASACQPTPCVSSRHAPAGHPTTTASAKSMTGSVGPVVSGSLVDSAIGGERAILVPQEVSPPDTSAGKRHEGGAQLHRQQSKQQQHCAVGGRKNFEKNGGGGSGDIGACDKMPTKSVDEKISFNCEQECSQHHSCSDCQKQMEAMLMAHQLVVQELHRQHEEHIQDLRETHYQAMQTAQLRLFIATNALENERHERDKIVEQAIAHYIMTTPKC
jgi:hypothetical protein